MVFGILYWVSFLIYVVFACSSDNRPTLPGPAGVALIVLLLLLGVRVFPVLG